MRRSPRLVFCIFCLAFLFLAGAGFAPAADCGCGGPATVPNCGGATGVVAPHRHCRHGSVCTACEPTAKSDRGARRDRDGFRDAGPATVVSSMPMFAMPMMFASVPVMPAVANRVAEPDRSYSDCHERLNRLENDLKGLAKAVGDLQSIVADQTKVLRKLNDEKADKKAN
jgi:hypothetical protein